MNLPAFRLFIDLLAGEGGHGGIEASRGVACKLSQNRPNRRYANASFLLSVLVNRPADRDRTPRREGDYLAVYIFRAENQKL